MQNSRSNHREIFYKNCPRRDLQLVLESLTQFNYRLQVAFMKCCWLHAEFFIKKRSRHLCFEPHEIFYNDIFTEHVLTIGSYIGGSL